MGAPAPAPSDSQATDISSLSALEFAGALASATPQVQKQMLGERLYWRIAKYQPTLAPKLTGMMLQHDNSELLNLLDSEWHLKLRIDEAVHALFLKKHQESQAKGPLETASRALECS